MRARAALVALLGAALPWQASAQAPSRMAAPVPKAPVTRSTTGPASRLAFRDGVLVFCDGRGGRRLDPLTGRDGPEPIACPADPEGDAACGKAALVAAVRGPLNRPDDILDFDGWSVPLDGRVHDCAGDDRAVAVVTGSQVVIVDVARQASRIVSRRGGERVALGPGWIAWTGPGHIHMAPR